jgi:inorganic pyrophosphatase
MDTITADVFIEIAKGSHIKYEYDKERKALVCDRILHTPFKYEFNYGFIPNTLSPDGDPLDVIVVMEDELIPGCYIKCKFIGILETEDDAGVDPKIIMCPCNKVDPLTREINDLYDLSSIKLERIKYFFTHYKDLENKKVKIGEFKGKEEAIQIFQQSSII